MANAILLNQSTEMTQGNILGKIGEDLIINIEPTTSSDDNNNVGLKITYIDSEGSQQTEYVNLQSWINTNIINFDSNLNYEAVT